MRTREKSAVGKSALKRRVCRPLADVNAAFRERAGARKRADIFLHRKTEQSELCSDVVEGDGFEPSKEIPTDLQSAPFGHSGTPPYIKASGAGDGT